MRKLAWKGALWELRFFPHIASNLRFTAQTVTLIVAKGAQSGHLIRTLRGSSMLIGLIVVVVGLVLYLMTAYNGLVRLKVQCDNAWSDIDVQLKRRYDLIPNIVETVKGYAAHEKSTLEGVVAARNQAMTAQGPTAKGEAEGMLTSALRQVFALAEAYPQLRAVESFTQLQNTLNEIEDTLQNARRYYNAVVRDFNKMIEQFPSNFVAGMGHFKEREFFQVSAPAEREVPKVSFGTTGA
jgi:LemA protein